MWSGSTPDSPGYTEVYTWHAVQTNNSPKHLEKDQVWDVCEVSVPY